MGNTSDVDYKAIAVGSITALGGLATIGVTFFYIIRPGEGADRWQALGMLAIAVAIGFAVAGMLRFALAPLIAPKSAPAAAATDGDTAIRSRIAPLVLTIGSIAIVVLAMTLIVAFAVLAQRNEHVNARLDTLLTGIFSTVLPVVATWVGTVLAFYFGSENFRQAAQSTRETLGAQLSPKKKITDVMIPYDRIGRLEAESDEEAAKIKMSSVINTMSDAATRVIVFNKKTQTPVYVIRSSTPPMPEKWIASDYGVPDDLPKETTIQTYLDANNGQNKVDAQKFGFISENATLEDALALMTKEKIDDLFITKDGQKTSQVLGWVATHDLLGK